jgi:single-strand DNA-binding protein
MCIARYTLAVDRRGKKQDGQPTADFISCVAFKNNAEFAEKYLHKGTKIAVVGRIQTGSYTNKDGNKVYTTDVIVDEHEFVESKASNQEETKPTENTDFSDMPEADLPFN